MATIIRTVKSLKQLLENIPDDFRLSLKVMTKVPEEVLAQSSYPYPWEYNPGCLEFVDIGHSDKQVCFEIYKEDDVK
jgi:hypothetical protein